LDEKKEALEEDARRLKGGVNWRRHFYLSRSLLLSLRPHLALALSQLALFISSCFIFISAPRLCFLFAPTLMLKGKPFPSQSTSVGKCTVEPAAKLKMRHCRRVE
jgi:hypothetical protein